MGSNTLTVDFASRYNYYIYHNLIRSLLLRKQGKVNALAEKGSTLLSWGISIWIGGAFSQANGEKVISVLDDSALPINLYYPDDEWREFMKNALSDKLKDKCLRVYQFKPTILTPTPEDGHIVPVTLSFMERNLPNAKLIADELYSYRDMEDFYQNGFGLALVVDGMVSGYCLSEYSVNHSHGINIWVDEQYRRSGYAKKMINAFLLHCQEKNQTAYWVCNADNVPSNKAAVSSGFVLTSTMHYFEI